MGIRSQIATKDMLINAPLPQQTKSYTVISHQFIIDKALEMLKTHNFSVLKELYRCNSSATIAQGIYHINCDKDPDMGMMFAWTNSYDKSLRFRCSIGGYVHLSNNHIISNEGSTWGRVHTGKADEDTEKTIEAQIKDADVFFKQLIHDKEAMKLITIDENRKAELTGRMYFVQELLAVEQMSVVKQEYKKPSFDYGVPADNAWAMYNAILSSLHRAHPKNWMDQQRLTHYFLTSMFGITPLAIENARKIIEAEKTGTPVPPLVGEQLEIKQDSAYKDREEATDETTTDDTGSDALSDASGQVETQDPIEKEEPKAEATEIVEQAEEPKVESSAEAMANFNSEAAEKIEEIKPKEEVALEKSDSSAGENVEVTASHDTSGEDEKIEEPKPEELVVPEPPPAPEIKAEKPVEFDLDENEPVTKVEPEIESKTPMVFELDVENNSWPCLDCGESQGEGSVFNDGQLCTKCFTK